MGKQDMMDLWMTSWRAYTAMSVASLDTLLTMQKSLMNLSSITLSDGWDSQDENYMREAFQCAPLVRHRGNAEGHAGLDEDDELPARHNADRHVRQGPARPGLTP
jgi:hypothetical protein